MNGYYQSAYGVVDHKSHQVVEESEPSPVPAPAPPKAAPRSTAPTRVTVGALREAKGASTNHRVPITQRVKEPEVPARFKLKKKTVAFGGTVNVSQTVERDKDPHPIERPLPSRPVSRIPPSTTPTMSLGRVGVGSDRPPYGSTRPLTGAARTPAAAATPSPSVPVGDENRPPTRGESTMEERKESTAHLETRIAELEKRERKNGEKHAELQAQFNKVVKIVTTLTQRVAELEVELEGRGGGGEKREKSSEDDESSRSRRRLYSPDEGGRRGEERREQRREKRGGGGLMDDQDAARVLERLSSNPLIRRHIDDAIEQDKYDREYGDEYGRGERRTDSPLMRRGGYADEYDDDSRGNGRCPSSAPTQKWKEDTRSRARLTPPRGGKGMGGGVGVTKKRSDITPSRRRVTERVTMERVHHFDDTDGESDGGGGGYERYERYDSDEPQYPRTQYSEEVVDDIQSAVLPKNAGRGGGYGQPPRRNQQKAVPYVTEVSDSEDDLERKRRLLKERLEARRGK